MSFSKPGRPPGLRDGLVRPCMNSSSNLRVYDSQNRFRFVTLAGPDKKEQIVPLEAARKVQLSFSILYLILISSS
jgi:hypothetical protein